MPAIAANCSSFLMQSSITATTPTPFNASSLDGYNNTVVFMAENSTSDTPLPTGIDTNLLDCLNVTIGIAVPLVDGASLWLQNPANFAELFRGVLLPNSLQKYVKVM
ncbi:hypothetical protein B0H14DRAFT_3500625 [Mycena olivaceomarginata]|nr:hypothetical protein B0H14DRAFT_3500625 [Mycena olivaceomarginata]